MAKQHDTVPAREEDSGIARGEESRIAKEEDSGIAFDASSAMKTEGSDATHTNSYPVSPISAQRKLSRLKPLRSLNLQKKPFKRAITLRERSKITRRK